MRRAAAAWLLAAFASSAPAQEVPPDLRARYEKLLLRLASDEFQERETATAEIAALPAAAARLVEATLAKADLDLDSRTRLERALPRLRDKTKREEAARKQAAFEAWTRKSAAEAYEKSGRKDERWDAKAREALRLVCLLWSEARTGESNVAHRSYTAAAEAITAGCDDPLILYVRARMYDTAIRKDFQEAVRFHVEAAVAMKERGGAYPPVRQAFVFARAGEFLTKSNKQIPDPVRAQAEGWLAAALDRYAEAARDPEVPDSILFEGGELLVVTWKTLSKDRKVGFDKVSAAFAKARPDGTLPFLLKGSVYINYAWDARGGGWASSVTDEGWKLMRERLAEAEEALTRAWEKDPGNARAPTLMLGVELGQGKGRAVMEAWFKRAMEADPDNLEACKKKMYYLEPKWHGSPEDMLNFGRQLLAEANWEARLPFQLIDAHLTLAGYAKDAQEKAAYYREPAVWKDAKAVYEPYLARHPDSAFDRTWYAKLACWCGRYAEANTLFEALGNKAVVSVFANRAEMDRLKAEAAEKGR